MTRPEIYYLRVRRWHPNGMQNVALLPFGGRQKEEEGSLIRNEIILMTPNENSQNDRHTHFFFFSFPLFLAKVMMPPMETGDGVDYFVFLASHISFENDAHGCIRICISCETMANTSVAASLRFIVVLCPRELSLYYMAFIFILFYRRLVSFY